MSISFESSEVQLQKLRERLRLMSDAELIRFGKQVRGLSEPRVGVSPDPWLVQLPERVRSGGVGIRRRGSGWKLNIEFPLYERGLIVAPIKS